MQQPPPASLATGDEVRLDSNACKAGGRREWRNLSLLLIRLV
jgi:hypothetical protein